MRHRLAAVSASVLLVLAGSVGVAQAEADSLYAPSALVLAIAQGDEQAAVLRASTLSCAPTAQGTHPDPEAACAELAATSGSLDRLLVAPAPDRMCPLHYDPVTVFADGVWQGERIAWKHTFSNSCDLSVTLNGNTVFAF
ncbi:MULTISPECIES: subtilase-type protease inhibitor [Streptomyces]|uniref:Subtilase-type protease inhibitor n=2 Tax=Streptomyces TaxID=1883 RepID=A0ABU4KI26_9ACTN|nr:subtilase-type protease inhibitor [Streptomyces roseolus]MDX2297465.1 subtilase-type protease inhibitor [Streptomyces roseolus]